MTANNNAERLLPSLYAFLSADPTLPSPHNGCTSHSKQHHPSPSLSSSTSFPSTTSHKRSEADVYTADVIAGSFARWRRCVDVWRRVIGNDILFLALLLHSGSLWSPDYAALHDARTAITKRLKSERKTRVGGDGHTPVKRKVKRGFQLSAENSAQAAQVMAEAADAHRCLTEACPESMFALHVLHFLRIEEVYAMPEQRSSSSNSSGDSSEDESVKSDDSSSSDSDSDSDSSSAGGAERRASGNEGDSDKDSDIVDVARTRRGGAFTQRSLARKQKRREQQTASLTAAPQRKKVRVDASATRAAAASSTSASPRRLAASSCLLPHGVVRQTASKKELESGLEAALAALRAEQQERLRRRVQAESSTVAGVAAAAVTATQGMEGKEEGDSKEEKSRPTPAQHTREGEADDDTAPTTTTKVLPKPKESGVSLSAASHAALLRATTTLVSEEEPLVQQVAAALVEDWLDLVAPSPCAQQSAAIKREAAALGGSAAHPPVPPPQRSAASSAGAHLHQMQQQQQQREARHYWLSCLFKMVSYLDGVHSALREENVHLAAVLARQGISPQEAEEMFTKSLPAIFNCALVEEAVELSHARGVPSLGTPLAEPRLWMPPAVLLLPLHFLARGSRLGVWVPATATPTAAEGRQRRTAGRASGRYISFTVESFGPQLRSGLFCREESQAAVSAAKHDDGGSVANPSSSPLRRAATRTRNNVSFAAVKDEVDGLGATCTRVEECSGCSPVHIGLMLRASEPEVCLEAPCRAAVAALLPRCDVAPQDTMDDGMSPTTPTAASRHASPLRWWQCTLDATMGCPRVEFYVARTLVMLPIPAQSSTDSSNNNNSNGTSGSPDAKKSGEGFMKGRKTTSSKEKAGGAAAGQTGEAGVGTASAAAVAAAAAVVRGRRGPLQRQRCTPEETAARRRHAALFHTLQHYLRSSRSSKKSSSTHAFGRLDHSATGSSSGGGGGGGGWGDSAQLVLLYGLARGEEAMALRGMGFSVRTGSHHGLGRGGGSAGGGGVLSSFSASPYRDDRSAAASPAGVSGGGGGVRSGGSTVGGSQLGVGSAAGGGSSGRLTLARDALGTTLEGLYLMARRVVSLRGLYAASASSAGKAAVTVCQPAPPQQQYKSDEHTPNTYDSQGSGPGGKGKGSSQSGKGSRRGLGKGGDSHGVAAVAGHRAMTPAQETELLASVAVTLVLTSLLLSRSLMDELLEQPSLTLWTTELASYIIDASLFPSRPLPRLLVADGMALSLLLQPAQSLLLMVGLAATLVRREADHQSTSTSASAPVSTHSSNSWSRAPVIGWHPWWTLFRTHVLRDATLPSCLHGGVWAVVTKAEEAMAAAAAQSRWEALGHTARALKKTKPDEVVDDTAGSRGAAAGGGRGTSGASRRAATTVGRRVLRLTSAASSTAAAMSIGSAGGLAVSCAAALADGEASGGLSGAKTAVAVTSRHRLHLVTPTCTSAPTSEMDGTLSLAPSSSSAAHRHSSPSGASAATQAQVRCLYGSAVLHQEQRCGDTGENGEAPLTRRGESWGAVQPMPRVCVVSAAPLQLWRDREELSAAESRRVRSAAAASALWLSMEATLQAWPSHRDEQQQQQ